MKNLILLFLFTLSFEFTFAQKATIEWGQPVKSKKRISFYDTEGDALVGLDFAGIVKSKLAVVKYDASFREIERHDLSLKSKEKNTSFYEVLSYNDKFVLITSFYDAKVDKNTMFAQFISYEGEFEGGQVVIDEADAKTRSKVGYYGFKLDEDSAGLLMYYSEPIDRKNKDVKKFRFKLLDKELKTSWEKSFELEYDDPFQVSSYLVDDNATLYMLLKLDVRREKVVETKEEKKARRELEKKNKERTKKRKYDSRFLIQIYNPVTDNLSEYDLNPEGAMKGKTITDLHLRVSDNKLTITGFYSETGTKINGCFIMKVDAKTEKVLLEKVKPFDKDFFESIATDSDDEEDPKKKPKKKEEDDDDDEYLTNYEIRNTVLKADGSMYVVAEQYTHYVTTYQSCDGNGNCRTVTVHHYIYGDILVLNIDKAGEVLWTSKIPKYQHTTGSAIYSSFILIRNENNLYFIYNDNPKNANLKNPKVYNMHLGMGYYKNVPVVVSMTADGKLSKSVIEEKNADTKKVKSILVPEIEIVYDGAFIVKRFSGKTYSFGKLRMN